MTIPNESFTSDSSPSTPSTSPVRLEEIQRTDGCITLKMHGPFDLEAQQTLGLALARYSDEGCREIRILTDPGCAVHPIILAALRQYCHRDTPMEILLST